jgi:hypothetical protein
MPSSRRPTGTSAAPAPEVRRRRLLAVLAAAAAAGLGVGLWFALDRGGGHGTRSEQAYLARVSGVCRGYARRLGRIGAPSDVTAYGDVIAAVDQVVPLLRRQAAAMQAVPPPGALRLRLDRLFALDGRAIAQLELVRAAARRRFAGGVASGLVRFSQLRSSSHGLAVAIGIDCGSN